MGVFEKNILRDEAGKDTRLLQSVLLRDLLYISLDIVLLYSASKKHVIRGLLYGIT